MIKHKILPRSLRYLLMAVLIFSAPLFSCAVENTATIHAPQGTIVQAVPIESHQLDEFFKLKNANEKKKSLEILQDWKTQNKEEQFYKQFFAAQVADKNEQAVAEYWKLYLDLKKSKKLLRLQLETLNQTLEILLNSELKKKGPFNQSQFKTEAKNILKKVRGLPEGLDFELKYLKWIIKNNISQELCKSERNRWLSQTTIGFKEVMDGLKKCPVEFDDFAYRTRLLIFSGEEKKAQDELNEYIQIVKLQEWEKAYLQAVFFSNVGDPTSAFKIAEKYEKDLLSSKDYYDNLFYIAQRAGELEKAEELINKIIAKAKTDKEKKEFTFQKAFLFYQTKRYQESITLLDKLIKGHSSRNKKKKKNENDDLTWLRAWCLYLNKDFDQAKKAFTENKEWTRDKARNLYWLAQTEWALGNNMQALDYFKQLAQPVLDGRFFNYYNYLSWLRFETNKGSVTNDFLRNQIGLMKSGRGPFMLPDEHISPMKMVEEYKTYFDEITVTDEGDIQVVNQDSLIAGQSETEAINIETTGQLKKEVSWADKLLVWGYPDLARWHLYDVEKSFKTRKSAEPLIQYYLEKKFYYRALSLMQKVSSAQGKKISLKDDELLWKSLYPKAYDLNVNSESMLRKINPYLIWSIMKAETQFKSDAISPVGAVGLMQFMPYTTQKVTQLLKEQAIQPRQLFQPDIAIQHGAMYLKKLSKEFDSQLPFVAAAYNGGPHRVKLWLRNIGEVPFDVFVEHIPFLETRTYVKRVLSFYMTYQKLYDDKNDYKKSMWLVEKSPFKLVEPISLKEEWDFSNKQ